MVGGHRLFQNAPGNFGEVIFENPESKNAANSKTCTTQIAMLSVLFLVVMLKLLFVSREGLIAQCAKQCNSAECAKYDVWND